MKRIAIFIVSVVGSLLVIGTMIEAAKSPEEKAREAAQAQERRERMEAARAKEQAEKALESLADRARDVLLLAYIERVKEHSTEYVRCRHAIFEGRLFFLCGLASGSTVSRKNGLWEVVESDGAITFYAKNGKALTSLKRIGESAQFQPGHSRPLVNRAELDELFES